MTPRTDTRRVVMFHAPRLGPGDIRSLRILALEDMHERCPGVAGWLSALAVEELCRRGQQEATGCGIEAEMPEIDLSMVDEDDDTPLVLRSIATLETTTPILADLLRAVADSLES